MTAKSTPPAQEVDLFGDPWTPPKDPRGRKRHKRSPQLAEKIAVLRAQGATQEEIADAVGHSVPTLTKYYLRELDEGPALAKAVVIQALWRKAVEGGNVSAMKAMLAQFDKGDALLADGRVRARGGNGGGGSSAPPAAAEPRLGKKAERQAAAERVVETGGRYATPAAPKLVVRNS